MRPVRLVERRDDFPPESQVHGQPGRDLPIVHEVHAVLRLAESLRIALNAVGGLYTAPSRKLANEFPVLVN